MRDAGGTTEGLHTGLTRFARSVGETADGVGEAQAAFEALGVAVKNADGSTRDIEEVLYDVSDGLAGITNHADRAAIANDLFGRQWARLNPLLGQGAAELKRLEINARLSGAVISEDLLTAAEEAASAQERLGTSLKATSSSLLLLLAPAITHTAEETILLTSAFKAWTDSLAGADTLAAVEGTFARISDEVATLNSILDPSVITGLPDDILDADVAQEVRALGHELRQLAGDVEGVNIEHLINRLERLPVVTGETQAAIDGLVGALRLQLEEQRAIDAEATEQAARRKAERDALIDSHGTIVAGHDAIASSGVEAYNIVATASRDTLLPVLDSVFEATQSVNDAITDGAQRAVALEEFTASSRLQTVGNFFDAIRQFGRDGLEENKELAIASIGVNTAAGVAQALAAYPPPFSFVQAAAVVATGLAQVRNVNASRPGSASIGVSGGAVSAGGGAITGEARPNINLTLVGDTFSRTDVQNLFDQLSDEFDRRGYASL